MRFGALLLCLYCWSPSLEASAAQAKSEAEALFTKLTEKIRTAKTLQIACQGQFKTAGFEADIKATLLMKEGNKMRMELETKGSRDGEPYVYSVRIVSDGSHIKIRENQGEWTQYLTTTTWNESIALNLVRGGFPTGLELMRIKKDAPSEDVAMAFRPVPAPTDFVLNKKDLVGRREATPIEFKVKSGAEFLRELDAILWLEPTSGLPLKRMNVVRSERTLTVTETYEKFAVNEAVDDASFTLPK